MSSSKAMNVSVQDNNSININDDMNLNDENNKDNEEEELLVYLDFCDFDDNDLFSNYPIQLIDIDSSIPKCKIHNLYFEGTHQINLGTQLFFNHNNNYHSQNKTNTINNSTSNTIVVNQSTTTSMQINDVEYIGKSVNVIKFELKLILPNDENISNSNLQSNPT